jgi:CheY-like chemotaxis protein
VAVIGDVHRIRQVLLNFLSNAVKFTVKGDVEVLVRQTEAGRDSLLRIEVKDKGIGVSPDQAEKIFERFAQADTSTSRQYGGTGLGLAISRQIIDLFGGQIGMTSAPGKGSTFWFEVSLPMARAVSSLGAVDVPPDGLGGGLRLLLAEDNAVNRELIHVLLTPFGAEIVDAVDGVEAVQAVADGAFDLILMDVHMPNMDGLTATRLIRAAAPKASPRVPIIAMTANVAPDQIAKCLEAGADDHVGKPIELALLLGAIDRWTRVALEAAG